MPAVARREPTGERATLPAAARISRRRLMETRAILLATDQATGRAAFQRWGSSKAACAELMIVLAAPFRLAMRDERPPKLILSRPRLNW